MKEIVISLTVTAQLPHSREWMGPSDLPSVCFTVRDPVAGPFSPG